MAVMKMKKEEIKLTNSEWLIMECLWQEAPRTLMQLAKAMEEKTDWAHSTTKTMVSRMEAKGYIRYKEGEKAREYYPILKRQTIALHEAKTVLNRFFDGKIGLLLNTLMNSESLSDHEIEELSAILDKAKQLK